MAISAAGWNDDLTEAPPNTRLLVETQAFKMIWATYDPSWGGGIGAWFNDDNHAVGSVRSWRADGHTYLSKFPRPRILNK